MRVNLKVPAITIDQMREVDRLMIEDYGITLVQMMENAGRNLAELARNLLGGSVRNKNITVVAGAGNNGGGGLVAGRYLSNYGAEVTVLLGASERKLKSIPLLRWQTLHKLPVKSVADPGDISVRLLKESHMIIDAVIGYGLQGEPRGRSEEAIKLINASENPRILSLDIPSGLNGDTGQASASCIRAEATLTLALPKKGLFNPDAKKYTGALYLADIGVPPSLYHRIGLNEQVIFGEEAIISIG
ncbi:MAG: NAD(P)H-hydrate epimerase [FCB group bacterium]|nr:NAD(P)H-hydrate epimerase [FCB group bacterium]